jgi:sterol desaturase/sphingolipid hydroxylase (fatty acid hydroxylase superfamily)
MSNVHPKITTWPQWFKYYADFFLMVAVIVAIFATHMPFRTPVEAHVFGAVLAIGFGVWTFAEYWTHRVILHRWFWHGTHEEHHLKPTHFVIFPGWYIPAAWLAFAVIAYGIGGLAWPFFAGFSLGYLWFLTTHDMLHHVADLGRTRMKWLTTYAIWHNRHHKRPDVNYGITTSVWDRVFGTYL